MRLGADLSRFLVLRKLGGLVIGFWILRGWYWNEEGFMNRWLIIVIKIL